MSNKPTIPRATFDPVLFDKLLAGAPKKPTSATGPATADDATLRNDVEIGRVVREIEAEIKKRAMEHSVSWIPGYDLNPPADPTGPLYAFLVHTAERVSVEKSNGEWSLVYTREANILDRQQRTAQTTPLRDASLSTREKFLTHAQAFVTKYLDMCRASKNSRNKALHVGAAALDALRKSNV